MSCLSRGVKSALGLVVAGALFGFGSQVLAAQSPQPKPAVDAPKQDAALYCENTADKAAEARLKWQTWKLVSLEAKLRERIEELNRKQEEFERWVERREQLLAEVEGQVVSIIAKMRPEAAAAQLATSDDETATGVLLKLKARSASQILDEMDPARAAQLTRSMVGFSADNDKDRSF
ncbi:MotE family protein [Roseibium sp. RKSG952]|uniref:MotE family protein n=1 Tax=Roseibium sp. RKSG952 TaxID=2529384 RepID=UPI0018AD2ECF|nr:MotE family protein [Roseibium sp. RKSG952]